MLNDSVAKRITYYKMSGAANDFIVIDNRNGQYSEQANVLAKKLCSRRYSIGADGLILIENSKKANFKARFFNADGSEFNLCGNGGRCAARFAFVNVIASKHMIIETNAGSLAAEILQNNVKLQVPLPVHIELNKVIHVENKNMVNGHFIIIGDPHFIAFGKNLAQMPFNVIAKAMRHSPSFGSEGSNIDLIMQVRENRFLVRTYERGVEDETLACGSGCISAAIALHKLRFPYMVYIFETRSGFVLSVYLQFTDNELTGVYLEGDARIVYKGEAFPEAWNY
ncbi:MAG: diaminopimelate epimerase [Candidatus Fischerbacteria bacterium RBG_13_37_8]|uniref:Diaminopimelate epimerase n=1 Tax=Candidatus Fischerbacteria bacterium RBG_13_37_8 TaxID=1817863 RepID=A0A1F5VPH2_9BACT|nr:MAG: diaminopimelate epimerase [Candidatus Fischerbacteria bacterium RBG_13_37_8]